MTKEIFEFKRPRDLREFEIRPHDVIDSILYKDCVGQNIRTIRLLKLNHPELYVDLVTALAILEEVPINNAVTLYELRMNYNEECTGEEAKAILEDMMWNVDACAHNNITIMNIAQRKLDEKWRESGPLTHGYLQLPSRKGQIYKFTK